MDTGHRRIIQENIDLIALNTSNLPVLLNLLLQKSILTEIDIQQINSIRTEYEKGTELALKLAKKDIIQFPDILDCCKASGNEVIAGVLERGGVGVARKTSVMPFNLIWFNVRLPTEFFSGRYREMHEAKNNWEICITKKILNFLVVTGEGGVGKSEFTKTYAKYFHENVQGHCIWIDAETLQSLTDSFHRLAKDFLKISINEESGNEKSLNELVTEIYDKLFDQKCLIIFDNIESYEEPILELLIELSAKVPPSILKPFVIITSRYNPVNKLFGSKFFHLKLDALEEEAATEFFLKSLDLFEKDVEESILEAINKLCGRLKFYPLSMQQAVSCISGNLSNGSKLEEEILKYLTIIDEEVEKPQYKGLESIADTTYLTWKVTFRHLNRLRDIVEEGIITMKIISLLSSDNICTEFILKLLQKMRSSALDDKPLLLLNEHSMIKYIPGKLITVHRRVQEVTRKELEENDELHTILEDTLKYIRELLEAKDVPLDQIIHVDMVWQHASKDKKLIKKHGAFPIAVCGILYDAGRYKQAYDFCCKTEELLEPILGGNNKWTLHMKYWKAVFLREKGEYTSSLQLLKEVYKRQKELLGENDDHYLLTAREIGSVHWNLKKYDKALTFFKGALDKREELSGNEHPATLKLKGSIILVYQDQGKYQEAIDLYQDVLEARIRTLGPEHRETLMTKYNIAAIKLKQKDFNASLQMLWDVSEIQERVLGSYHRDLLKTHHSIALALHALSRYEEALEEANKVYEKQVDVLGEQHHDTVSLKKLVRLLEKLIKMHNELDLDLNPAMSIVN